MKFTVAYAKPSLAFPGRADYDAVANSVLTSNKRRHPRRGVRARQLLERVGMQQALTAAGYLGLFTEPDRSTPPNLVAPSTGAFVFTQTAPVETAPTTRP